MRYAKLLATLSGAGAITALSIPAHGTRPSQGSHARAITARRLSLPMCHHTPVGSCSLTAVQGTTARRNGRILFQGNVGRGTQLFSIRPDGSGLVQVTHVPANQAVADGAWSADGAMIAYSLDLHSHGRGEIARADGSHAHAITPLRFQFAGDPDWLPGGRRLVVGALSADPAEHRKCDSGLRLLSAAGKLIRAITHQTGAACRHEHWDVNADVSPDGRRIAFDASSPGGDSICVIGLNGRGRRCLTARSEDAAHPVWSPGGTKILFQTHHDPERNRSGATANLFSIRPNGGGLTQITHLRGAGSYAGMGAWSPDGTQIVYHKVAPNGVDDLFLIDLDGGNERQLTHLGPDVHPGGVDWGTNQG